MEFIINQINYREFLYDNSFIYIDEVKINEIIKDHEILRIENIHDNLEIVFRNFSQPGLKIQIDKITTLSINIRNIEVDALSFFNVKNSEKNNSSFHVAAFKIANSKFKSIYFLDSQFYNSISIGEDTSINHFDIRNTFINNIFSLSEVKISTISLNKSSFDDINFNSNTYDKPFKLCTIESINFHDCEINRNVVFEDVIYKNLAFNLVNVKKKNDAKNNQSFRINNNHIEDKKFKISIINTTIPVQSTIRVKKLEKLFIEETTFDKLTIRYDEAIEVGIYNTSFSNFVNIIPFTNTNKIKKLHINNSIFENVFYFTNSYIENECIIQGNQFHRNPSFFSNIQFNEKCETTFEYSNLDNFVFKEINFNFFKFINLDTSNCKFIGCKWNEENKIFFERALVYDEAELINKEEGLLNLKNIYSLLKLNSLKNSDFANYGKFYVSEQETKRKYYKLQKKYFEHFFLTLYKQISSYGESFSKPLLLLFINTLLFSVLYMFTGFYEKNSLVQFELSIDLGNTLITIKSFFYSLIFSLKNVLPFNQIQAFFIKSNENLWLTQFLELLNRALNLIFVTSFTGALIRHFRK